MPPQDPNAPQPGFSPPPAPQPPIQPPQPGFDPAPSPSPGLDPMAQPASFQPPAPAAPDAYAPAAPADPNAFTPPAPVMTPDPMAQPASFQPPAPAAPTVNLPPPTDPNMQSFGAPQPAAFNQPMPPVSPSTTFPSTPGLDPYSGSSSKKSKLPLMIGSGIAVVLVIGAGIFAATKLLGGGIKLEEFSNSKMSFLHPADYEKEETSRNVRFKEEGDRKTASSVYASVTSIPSYYSQSEIDSRVSEIKDRVKGIVEDSIDDDANLKDYNIEEVDINGKKALRFKTVVERDGKKLGEISGIFAQGDKVFYTIEVLAHVSDKGVLKNANKIIDSMKLKDGASSSSSDSDE